MANVKSIAVIECYWTTASLSLFLLSSQSHFSLPSDRDEARTHECYHLRRELLLKNKDLLLTSTEEPLTSVESFHSTKRSVKWKKSYCQYTVLLTKKNMALLRTVY